MRMRSVWRGHQRAAHEADDQLIQDDRLIERVRSGDSHAFGELYRRHRPAAESTARWLLRSRAEADDVVADAFAGVLSAIRNGNGPRDNFRSYLLAAVRNGCRTRRRRFVTADVPRADAGTAPMFEDPERYVEADTVARAFASLNPRWQQTLWLTEVEQRSPAEVAAVMNLAPNATAALTLRAREAFATAYLAEHVNASSDEACERYGRRLAAYVRDQLTEIQSDEVERHLLDCPRCQQAVDELRDVNASLRKLVPPVGSALAAQWTLGTTLVGTVSNLFSSGLLLKGAAALLVATPLLINILGGFGRGGTPVDAEVRTVVAAPEEPEAGSARCRHASSSPAGTCRRAGEFGAGWDDHHHDPTGGAFRPGSPRRRISEASTNRRPSAVRSSSGARHEDHGGDCSVPCSTTSLIRWSTMLWHRSSTTAWLCRWSRMSWCRWSRTWLSPVVDGRGCTGCRWRGCSGGRGCRGSCCRGSRRPGCRSRWSRMSSRPSSVGSSHLSSTRWSMTSWDRLSVAWLFRWLRMSWPPSSGESSTQWSRMSWSLLSMRSSSRLSTRLSTR